MGDIALGVFIMVAGCAFIALGAAVLLGVIVP